MKSIFKDDDSWTEEGTKFDKKISDAVTNVFMEYSDYNIRELAYIAITSVDSVALLMHMERKQI